MLLLLTGTRHATIADHGLIVQRTILGVAVPGDEPRTLFVGDCPTGVDFIAEQLFGVRPGWVFRQFEAEWEECGTGCPPRPHRRNRRSGGVYCPYAGPRRNRRMVERFVADGGRTGLAFPDRGGSLAGSGTWGCAKEAVDRGVRMCVESLVVNRHG